MEWLESAWKYAYKTLNKEFLLYTLLTYLIMLLISWLSGSGKAPPPKQKRKRLLESILNMPGYTMKQVRKHNREHDCWVVVDGFVYDLTSFIGQHPGGGQLLVDRAGKDVTEDFYSDDHTENAETVARDYLIGKLV
eukprot:TRINITY_DN3704_c0_g1_i1.p1 TRINITY_DN3704_c0_g1~~TRINITY_DN3704_c0_g1_i1.p1  ORF type:complete len:136 (+),score=31.48 TRINITY_DN3704_c0_g1_i1:2-409(+)